MKLRTHHLLKISGLLFFAMVLTAFISVAAIQHALNEWILTTAALLLGTLIFIISRQIIYDFALLHKKQLESQILKAQNEAILANRLKTEFLANMSHEIRTPLNAIIGMADLLWDTPLNPEQKKYVEIFRRAGDNLLRLVNDILDISKVEAGKITIEAIGFDLLNLVEDLSELMAIKAQDKSITYNFRIHSDVDLLLVGDPTRLRQILMNLIGNAIKFTDQGEVTLEVEKNPKDPHLVLFKVTDKGPGISKQNESLVFQKFTQMDGSTTRKYGGTGLGLAITKNLVDLMGGTIGFTNNATRGTTFYFSLPLPRQNSPLSHPLKSYYPGLFNQRAMIICRHPFAGATLHDYLSTWGLQCHLFSSTEEALNSLQTLTANSAYHLLVVDDDLQGQALKDFRQKLAEQTQATANCIIVSSDLLAPTVRQYHGDENTTGILKSPIRYQELLALTLRFLDRLSSTRSNIVFVDDENEIQSTFQYAVTDKDWKVFYFSNGKEALNHILANKTDLVLSDLNMPVMNGIVLLENIRARNLNVPFILCSAFADNEILQKVRKLDVNAVFEKPVGVNVLIDAIENILEKREIEKTALVENLKTVLPTALKILLVDDSEDNRILIKSYLKGRPYHIDEADNGKLAIEKFSQDNFDLIFMDIQMPLMDGLTAITNIRKIERERKVSPTPIIALTANATNEDQEKTKAAGSNYHLNKPVKKQVLLDLINSFHLDLKKTA